MINTRCIDRKHSPASPVNDFSPFPQLDAAPSSSSSSSSPKTHFVVVRDDPPKGVLAANVLHAAGESGPAPPGSIAVALAVSSEADLLRVAARLDALQIAYVMIREDAGPYAGQMMAIGIPPVTDRAAIRKATSDLRLVK